MVVEGHGRCKLYTNSVTATPMNDMFPLLRACVVIKGMLPILQATLQEGLHGTFTASNSGSKQSIMDLHEVVNVVSLQSVTNPSSHLCIDDLITNIANMVARSAVQHNIYVRSRRKVV